jgi:DNA-binding transcriptional MerR regulator
MADQSMTKLYFTIGEVSARFGVAPSLIRYWETEFRQLHPAKSTRGDRRYTAKDIEVVEQIYHLVKERGFTIEGARRELEDQKKQRKQETQVLERLLIIREKLLKLLPEDRKE